MRGYGSHLVRVFVLDDHDIVRRGLLDLLTTRDITVVGDSGSAEEATRRILHLRPDVMVLDVQLQDGSGVQVCRDVRSTDPSIAGVLLTSAGDEEALTLSVLAGAAGVLVKLAGTHGIVDAVRRVGAGRPLRERVDTERVRKQVEAQVETLDPPLAAPHREMLSLVLAGCTDQEIAAERGQPLALVREEVAKVIARLTTLSTRVDPPGSGTHRRDS